MAAEIFAEENAIVLAAAEKMVALGSEASQRFILGKESKDQEEKGEKILKLLTVYRQKDNLTTDDLESILYCLRAASEEHDFPTISPIVGQELVYLVHGGMGESGVIQFQNESANLPIREIVNIYRGLTASDDGTVINIGLTLGDDGEILRMDSGVPVWGEHGGWLLDSGGLLTGENTITSNAENQLTFDGTWTATGTPKQHVQWTGSITARATASDVLRYMTIDPTLVSAAATQTLTALYLNPTFTDANSATKYNFRVATAGTDIFSIISTGFVGIDVTPAALFHIKQQSEAGTLSTQGIRIERSGSSSATNIGYSNTGRFDFLFSGNFNIDGQGNNDSLISVGRVLTITSSASGSVGTIKFVGGGATEIMRMNPVSTGLNMSIGTGANPTSTDTRLQITGKATTTGFTLLLEASGGADTFAFTDGGTQYVYIEPANDDALTQVLVRDGATGQIKYRAAASLSGGITNTAADTELMMSDGADAVASGIFLSAAATISTYTYFDANIEFSNVSDHRINSTVGLELVDGSGTSSLGLFYKDIQIGLEGNTSLLISVVGSEGSVGVPDSANVLISTGDAYGTGNNDSGHLFLTTGANNGSGLQGNIALFTGSVADWQDMEKGLFVHNIVTEPSAAIADGMAVYSVDESGSSILGLFVETAVAADIAVASTNSMLVKINGTLYKILLATP